ncbi:hypothetical protein DFH11DRAFT_864614 [Phellopilus nigrolimitatus]|nr:hypothetical protein DFH11DRAFT_864614 [Phellopilus nigrolimitatus]
MSEVEEAFRQIVDHETDNARIWKTLREDNTPLTTARDSRVRDFVTDISSLSDSTFEDFDEYCLLEETFQQILECHNGSQAIALHWRALLHSYDRRLGSFSDAFEKTSEVLCEGFLEVFTLAGKVPPPSLIDDVRVLASKNRVVEHASQLAETVKTGFFSVNLEVFVADPGSLYDNESMLLDGQEPHAGEAAIIKCTIGLGLREILPVTPDSGTETKRVLLKSKVLL